MRDRIRIGLRGSTVWTVLMLAPGCPMGPSDGESADPDGEQTGTPRSLAVFEDPSSESSTTDVHDVDEQIVRFDTATDAIIWVADDLTFNEGFWVVDGPYLDANWNLQVRFGTRDGQRRAYFTETGPATICDLFLEDGRLRIVPTDVHVAEERAAPDG